MVFSSFVSSMINDCCNLRAELKHRIVYNPGEVTDSSMLYRDLDNNVVYSRTEFNDRSLALKTVGLMNTAILYTPGQGNVCIRVSDAYILQDMKRVFTSRSEFCNMLESIVEFIKIYAPDCNVCKAFTYVWNKVYFEKLPFEFKFPEQHHRVDVTFGGSGLNFEIETLHTASEPYEVYTISWSIPTEDQEPQLPNVKLSGDEGIINCRLPEFLR